MQQSGRPCTLPVVAIPHVATQAPVTMPDRASLIAELESLPVGESTDQADASPAQADAAVETSTSPKVETAAPMDEAPTAETPSKAEPVDAETQKRLTVVQKQMERNRQALAKERADALAEIEKQRSEIAPLLDQVKRFEAARARAKYEPDAVIEELLGSDVDYDYASKRFFVKSKAAAGKPELAGEVRLTQKEREHEDRLARIERENQELRQSLAAREEQQTQAQVQAQYLDTAVKAANDETPLLAQLVAKNPAKAKSEIWQTFVALYNETGEVPEPADVAAAYESRRASELAELGIDVASIVKRRAPAAPSRPSTTLAAAPSGGTQVPAKKTREQIEADVLRELESIKD